MSEFEKFRLEEHLLEMEETRRSAPEEVEEAYDGLISQLNDMGLTSSRKRASFLTFWLGVELQEIFRDVLAGKMRRGKYFQLVCATLEDLLKFSFNDTRESAWALGSVMKEIAEESMRIQKQMKEEL
ncbi:MAG: hypothetical protein ACLFVP_09345 [Candidatus Bathyarchaeia archaeon]